MKKHLRTLTCCIVSFGSMAFAETKELTMENFNDTLAEIAETKPIEYQITFRVYSDDYDMQHSGYLMMLSDDWGIYAHGGGYIGMANVEKYGHLHSEINWVYPTTFYTSSNAMNWVWSNSGDYQLHSLISRTSGGGMAQTGSEGMFVTLSVTDTGSTISLAFPNYSTTSIIKTGYVIDLADVVLLDGTSDEFNEGVTGISHASITYTPTIPEPTTATLSLLALAGLAARRRRK